jgi:hypothetical protein
MVFCKGKQKQSLSTIGGKSSFELSSVEENERLVFTVSTRKQRSSGRNYIQKVLDHYAMTGSLEPGDYISITMNASYILRLIKLYLENQSK